MKWFPHLYMGKMAEAAGGKLLEKIENNCFLPNVYVITAPKTGNHLFEICPVVLIRDSERSAMRVYGVALGYSEAAEVVRKMVEDMVRATGGYDWEAYICQMDDLQPRRKDQLGD